MTLEPSASVLLCAAPLCHIKDLPHGNAAHIKIIVSQLVENVEQFIECVQEKAQSVASLLDVYCHASLSLKRCHHKVLEIVISMVPN